MAQLEKAANLIHSAVSSKMSIVLFCNGTVDSPAFVIGKKIYCAFLINIKSSLFPYYLTNASPLRLAYLIKYRRQSFKDAYNYMVGLRKVAIPHGVVINQLIEMELKYLRTISAASSRIGFEHCVGRVPEFLRKEHPAKYSYVVKHYELIAYAGKMAHYLHADRCNLLNILRKPSIESRASLYHGSPQVPRIPMHDSTRTPIHDATSMPDYSRHQPIAMNIGNGSFNRDRLAQHSVTMAMGSCELNKLIARRLQEEDGLCHMSRTFQNKRGQGIRMHVLYQPKDGKAPSWRN